MFYVGWQHRESSKHHGKYPDGFNTLELAQQEVEALRAKHIGIKFWVSNNTDIICNCPLGSHWQDEEMDEWKDQFLKRETLTARQLIEALEKLPSMATVVIGIKDDIFDVSAIIESAPENPKAPHYILLTLIEKE